MRMQLADPDSHILCSFTTTTVLSLRIGQNVNTLWNNPIQVCIAYSNKRRLKSSLNLLHIPTALLLLSTITAPAHVSHPTDNQP